MADTFAVVVSYNDAPRTLACVDSLKNQARVVVWDNASTDYTVEALEVQHPDVTVHVSEENVLWSPALNGAVEKFYDGEDYLLFSNNDIVYGTDTVDRLKTGFTQPDAGIVAPSGSALGGQQDFVTHHPQPRVNGVPVVAFDDWVDQCPTVRANYVVGASMMVSREAWEDIGKFDPNMPLGADDHDYCIRAKARGWTIWVVNSAYVRHKGHASFPNARTQWDEWGKKSWDAFNRKWAGYYHNEEEAKKCHWESEYTPGWDFGTGWMAPEDRATVWANRDVVAQAQRP